MVSNLAFSFLLLLLFFLIDCLQTFIQMFELSSLLSPFIILYFFFQLNGAQKRKAQVYREKKWKYLQTQIFNLLERPRTKISVIYHAMV